MKLTKSIGVPSHEVVGFRSARYPRVEVMTQAHRHYEVEINFLESGSLDYLINGTLVRFEAGRLAVFWAAVPHQVVHTESARGFSWITIPLAWVLAWPLPVPWRGRLLEGHLIQSATQDSLDCARLAHWTAALKRADPSWERVVALEVEARLLQLVLEEGSGENPIQAPAPRGLKKVEQLARFIATHSHEPITANDIAKAANLNPHYAMTLFREHFGHTMIESLLQHRVAHAQRLLVTTHDKVLDIALASGFGSSSRFYTAFSEACGQTPLAYRQHLRSHGSR
ncbi:MAG TPA: helix-turn-helix domain-containing protein [Chthoniobacterales bacterium]|jgi:AraC-like DNA-binding protein